MRPVIKQFFDAPVLCQCIASDPAMDGTATGALSTPCFLSHNL